jgi:ribosomal protein S18 acetylase RimI-like enzyme
MQDILDNPAWNGLNTGNRQFAIGTEKIKYFRNDVSRFAAMQTNSALNNQALFQSLDPGSTIAVFSTSPLKKTAPFQEINRIRVIQLLYEAPLPAPVTDIELVRLSEEHIPAMLALTQLTQPGPFLNRTIDFGNYYGIFKSGKLVAMSGQRLKPMPFVEISAVCCHPDHLGKGYASRLIQHQVRIIKEVRSYPFLHVTKGNKEAIKLYDKLRFTKRREMLINILHKPQ